MRNNVPAPWEDSMESKTELDDLRAQMRDAGRYIVLAHNLVVDVFHEAVESDAPEEFLDTVEECLNRLNALRKIQNPAMLFGGERK